MESKTNKPSIGWKLLLYLSIFSAILLLVLWMLQIVFMEDFYRFVRTGEAKEIANVIVRDIDSGNEDKIGEYMNSKSLSNDVSIAIADKDGGLTLFSTGSAGTEMYRNLTVIRDTLIRAITSGTKTAELTDISTNKGYVVHLKHTADGRFVTVISALRPIDATVNTIKNLFLYLAGFMVVASILMAWIISKKISDPLKQLNTDAVKFAEGTYDVTFKGKGYKEVEELSETLNYAKDELGKMETYRKELMANVSHDLRTPLTLIEGYAEAMRDIPGENNQENAQIIIDESRRLTSLVNDVLDFSKMSNNHEELNKTTFDLAELARTETERVATLVKKDGYDLVFESSGEVKVNADAPRIKQVIYNLLINAVNYSDEDKSIKVSVEKAGNTASFSVTDHGPGIKPEEKNLIWERYYKSKSNHKRAVTGSGMGLAIVRTIISAHGGTYGVESTGNSGSTFWFKLNC
ncbi:MAG: HAMP domain-containing sensor histidine kinase [Clostridiaceae bacterium]